MVLTYIRDCSAIYLKLLSGIRRMSEKLVGKTVLKRHEVAKPVHIQRLEAALDVRPFVAQVEKILNSDGPPENDEDSDTKSIYNEMSKGDKLVHGVVTTKQGEI